MRKLVLMTTVIFLVAVFACQGTSDAASDKSQGKEVSSEQTEDTAYTPAQRRQAWRNFNKEHPEQARMMMRVCRQNPELGCGAMMGIGPGGRGGSGRMGPDKGLAGKSGRMRPGRKPGHMGPGTSRGGMKGERGGPRVTTNPEFAKKADELRSLKQEIRGLGMEYRSATDDAKKKELEETINKKLGQVYELKREVMHKRVETVEQRLKQVKKELEKYENDRNGVIKAWFERVTGQTAYKRF